MKSKLIKISDSKNQVLIDILHIISESERWYSLKEIASAINLSDRSSQRYVNQLYDIVISYNNEKKKFFSLLMKKNHGIKLLINSQANVEFLVNYILQEDENIKLLTALLFKDYETMVDYTNQNFLCTYSINQACIKCNNILSLFSLKIDKKNFELNGSESNIRIFIYNFCWSLYNSESWPECFEIVSCHEIESDILYLTEALSIPIINPIKLKKIMYCLTIFLIRCNKKKIVLSENLRRNVPIYMNESDNPVLIDIVSNIFNKHSIYNQDEIYSFILYLLCGSGIYRSPYIKRNILEYHNKINSEVFQATILFFNIFQKNISMISEEDFDTSFEFIFRSHLKVSMYLELNIEFEKTYFSDDTLDNYVIYSNKMKEIIEMMKNQQDLILFKEVIYLSQRYIMLFLSLDFQKNYNKLISIKLDTDYPSVYEDFIKKYLRDYFKYDYNLIFIDNNYYQKPDLILNSLPESYLYEQRVINITYPICDRDLEKIQIILDDLK